MIHRNDNKIYVKGTITIDNVAPITKQGAALFDGSDLVIDLAEVTDLDSSIVSMMLEWSREAKRQKHQLCFINVPENLYSLIQLYGISEFITFDHDSKERA